MLVEVLALRLVQFVKRMLPQTLNVDTITRVRLKDLLEDVLGFRGEEFRGLVICTHDFFVEVTGFLVFVR